MSTLHPGHPDDGLLYVTRAPALRHCWHPVAFAYEVAAEPVARRLLGTDIVVWRTDTGDLASALDRCPHRWAKLSAGAMVEGSLECPYHGWRFGSDGRAVAIPQLEQGAAMPPAACLEMLAVLERYGMVWVNLDPVEAGRADLPHLPEFDDPGFRAIQVGVIRYDTSAPVVIDNNTDATHVAFVHAGSFGADQDPRIPISEVERTAFGIRITTDAMPVARTPSTGEPGFRLAATEMWLPFFQVGRMTYSDGSTHILVKGCCPVDDGHTDVHLTVLRNDIDDPADVDAVIAFELTVEREDKAMLDTVPGGFPLDPTRQAHTAHDRPGIAYRRALAEFVGHPH